MWSVGLAPVILRGSRFDCGGGTTCCTAHGTCRTVSDQDGPLHGLLFYVIFISIFLGFEEANFVELRNRYMFNTKHHFIPNIIV